MNVVRFHPRPIAETRLVPSPAELPPMWKTAWPIAFWLCWGLWLAVTDMRNDDIQPAVLRVILGAGVLAFAQPQRWVFAAIATALWVPAEPIVARVFGLEAGAQNIGSYVLPLLPALMGAFLGHRLAGFVASRRRRTSPAAS